MQPVPHRGHSKRPTSSLSVSNASTITPRHSLWRPPNTEFSCEPPSGRGSSAATRCSTAATVMPPTRFALAPCPSAGESHSCCFCRGALLAQSLGCFGRSRCQGRRPFRQLSRIHLWLP
jgi:hypothetical protein